MKFITISREYGAGGRELADRLLRALGWEVLDRAILHRAAALEECPDSEFERIDEKPLSFGERFQLHPIHERYIRGLREATRRAVERGSVILVGRGTRHILGDVEGAFHLRLEASAEWRAERIARLEGLPHDAALSKCIDEDRVRGRFMRYFFGAGTEDATNYHLVVNTESVPLDDVVGCLVHAARDGLAAGDAGGGGPRRVVTMTGELGAGDEEVAPALAASLGLKVYDRALLELESRRLHVGLSDLGTVDEHGATLLDWFRAESLHNRYCEALRAIMGELAQRGDVVIVGRGGCRFLKDDPQAFHARLVAAHGERLRRVMASRWLAERPARQLLDRTDAHRRKFYETLFGVDWTSPLGYHITVDTARRGPGASALVSHFAQSFWRRAAANRR